MPSKLLLVIRWMARSSAILLAGTLLVFAIGEIVTPHSGPPTLIREWIGLALTGFWLIGMLLGLRWELLGGLISLCSLIAFVCVINVSGYGVIFIAAIPAMLFLLDWALRHFHRSVI